MKTLADDIRFPAGNKLLARWQDGNHDALDSLRAIFDAVFAGQFDSRFREPADDDFVGVTTSLHLLTLTILNQLYGITSADFYKSDPVRFVRTTLMTQYLLGIRKFTLGWPVYAFGAEALGQVMMYPDKHAPGADPGMPLVDRANWRDLSADNLGREIPVIIEDMLACFQELTGLEPVAHLPAPYSLAADIFGQEALISALVEGRDFVVALLDHLTDEVFVPWIERLNSRFPLAWIELSDASGSPLFISPRMFYEIAAQPVLRLINDYRWGDRIFVANYRGDHLVQSAGKARRTARSSRRSRRGRIVESGAPEVDSSQSALVELIEFKLRLCPQFLIKLEADEVPVAFYVEQAIRHKKPLYLGIGATRIDRNSLGDPVTAAGELNELVAGHARAIAKVSESLARTGSPRSKLSWPGDIYLEDVNAESALGLLETVISAVRRNGKVS